MPEIEFHNVGLELGGKEVLRELNFRVFQGETLVLLGASGSGKTSTLRLVNALLMPTTGSVTVQGTSTREADPVRLRRSIGYIIQNVGLLPHLNVLKNTAIVPRLSGIPRQEASERARRLLDTVGLSPDEFEERHPHELSGGQQQRVGVARALAMDPPILLCDEPFGALDPITRSTLQDEFSKLREGLGKTIVFVTHDVREAQKLGDRIALMDDGRVHFLGTVDEFTESADLRVKALMET